MINAVYLSKYPMRTLFQRSILFTRIFYPQALRRMSTNFFQTELAPKVPGPGSIEIDNELQMRAHELCSEHLGGSWSYIAPSELTVTPVSGGMSNAIYCCSLPSSVEVDNGEPTQVLLRIYGDQTGNCDIDVQLEIFSMLSNLGLGPKLYGKFDGGRLEEYLIADSLTGEQMRNSEISSIIAKKLAQVHSLNVPMDKTPDWIRDKYNDWIEFIRNTDYEETLSVLNESTIDVARKLLAIDFRKETDFVLETIRRLNSPITFSHNDLHQGNILLAKHSKNRPTYEQRLFLIDFEYCSYNYRAYDIANHFCEWCFEYDTPEYPHFEMKEKRFPSKDDQINFLRNYAKQLPRPQTNGDSTHVNSNRVLENGGLSANTGDYCNGKLGLDLNGNDRSFESIDSNDDQSPQEAIEETLLAEIKPFLMAANLLWTLWCIKSAKTSSITFGYWEHAMARWTLYSSFKDSFLEENSETRNGL